MSVPATGGFSMFGYFNNTTIQGAIAQGGGSVNGDTEFQELIDASTTSRFHPASNGGSAVTNLNQVTNALQYRRYPTFTISLCHDSTDSDGACDCDHGSATYYVFGDSTSDSSEVTQFAQAHTITQMVQPQIVGFILMVQFIDFGIILLELLVMMQVYLYKLEVI